MAAKPYIKLDWDWADCPEAILLRKRYGSKALLGWIQLMILMAEFGGAFNLADEMQMETAKKRMRFGKSDKVRELVERCAECGLVNDQLLRVCGRATSARAARDARARENRREFAKVRAGVVDNSCIPSATTGSSSGKPSGMKPLADLM